MVDGADDKQTKQALQMDGAAKAGLRSSEVVPREIDVRGQKFYPKEYGGEGFGKCSREVFPGHNTGLCLASRGES